MRTNKKSLYLAWVFCMSATLRVVSPDASAGVLYESATLGTVGHSTGFNISSQFLASRFRLTSTANVAHVGGHIGNFLGQPLFAAIVNVDTSSGLPTFLPSQIETSAISGTTFTPDRLSSEVTVPLVLQLPPGDYGLVFGAGAFGSPGTSQGFLPCIGSCGPSNPASFVDWDLPDASYFRGSAVFEAGGFSNTRFFVLGNSISVPEPTTLALLVGGLFWLSLLVSYRSHRAQPEEHLKQQHQDLNPALILQSKRGARKKGLKCRCLAKSMISLHA